MLDYSFVGSAFKESPVLLSVAIADCGNGEIVSMQPEFPFGGVWGESNLVIIRDDNVCSLPIRICIIYLSLNEGKYYIVDYPFPKDKVIEFGVVSEIQKIIVGMGPYGIVSFWVVWDDRQVLLTTEKVESISMSDMNITQNDLEEILSHYSKMMRSTAEYSLKYYTDLLKCCLYRFNIDFVKGNNFDTDFSVSHDYYNGSKYYNDYENWLLYKSRGLPKTLNIKWGKTKEYSVFFWMDRDSIINIFNRFYGAHPETKADFIIRIDPEKKKYELALFRQGLKEPVKIPECAYQLIVFKNKFEDYRSANYTQPRGAWIW